jgi:hypothetical protein
MMRTTRPTTQLWRRVDRLRLQVKAQTLRLWAYRQLVAIGLQRQPIADLGGSASRIWLAIIQSAAENYNEFETKTYRSFLVRDDEQIVWES